MSNLPKQANDFQALSSAKLAKAVFQAEVPEQFIRSLPAQTLFLVVKHNGLDSSADLISMAGIEQTRLLMDFDCWHGDEFNEDNFWEWLGVTDANEDLSLLQKVLKAADLEIISLLISKYVKWVILEEPTDEPPAPEYFTPDKGTTWLNIQAPDSNKTFLLGRLLAMIFETDAELFYELLSTTGMETDTAIVEDAYQNKQKRLAAEGIPDDELAFHANTPLPDADVKAILNTSEKHTLISDIRAVTPLIYDSLITQPLRGLISKLTDIDEFESELTFIMNCAVVRWKIDLWNSEELQLLTEKVKGAINIGLELAMSFAPEMSDLDIFNKLGLQKLYRLGLNHLYPLNRAVRKYPKEVLKDLPSESFSLVAGLLEPFPLFPNCYNRDGSLNCIATGELAKGYQAFEKTAQIELVQKLLTAVKEKLTQ